MSNTWFVLRICSVIGYLSWIARSTALRHSLDVWRAVDWVKFEPIFGTSDFAVTCNCSQTIARWPVFHRRRRPFRNSASGVSLSEAVNLDRGPFVGRDLNDLDVGKQLCRSSPQSVSGPQAGKSESGSSSSLGSMPILGTGPGSVMNEIIRMSPPDHEMIILTAKVF